MSVTTQVDRHCIISSAVSDTSHRRRKRVRRSVRFCSEEYPVTKVEEVTHEYPPDYFYTRSETDRWVIYRVGLPSIASYAHTICIISHHGIPAHMCLLLFQISSRSTRGKNGVRWLASPKGFQYCIIIGNFGHIPHRWVDIGNDSLPTNSTPSQDSIHPLLVWFISSRGWCRFKCTPVLAFKWYWR